MITSFRNPKLRYQSVKFLLLFEFNTLILCWLDQTTVLTRLPMFSTQHSTTSPTLRNWGWGFIKTPTPGGVPVRMISPGRRVMN